MPAYEYQCSDCGYRFERLQKFSDPILDTCPQCNGRVNKLISQATFKLNGSGWYATDYAKKQKEPSNQTPCGENCGKKDPPCSKESK